MNKHLRVRPVGRPYALGLESDMESGNLSFRATYKKLHCKKNRETRKARGEGVYFRHGRFILLACRCRRASLLSCVCECAAQIVNIR